MEAISCLLQVEPCEDRAILLWAQSVLLVACILHFWPNVGVVAQLKSRLSTQGVTLQNYSFQHFMNPDAHYLRLPFRKQWLTTVLLYLGSTADGMYRREANRNSKYRQVLRGQLVKAELSIRYWAKHNNFFDYTTIVLGSSAVSTPESRTHHLAREHTLIAEWQTRLNFPYIQKFLKLKESGFQVIKPRSDCQYSFNGKRFFFNASGRKCSPILKSMLLHPCS